MAEAYPPIRELIPHADPMVLLDELVHWAPGEARCSLTIAPGTPFVLGRGRRYHRLDRVHGAGRRSV